jgi:hypothetical protein
LPFGEYVVKELESPEGFVLLDEAFDVAIREHGQMVLLVVLNEPECPPEEPPCEPKCPGEPQEPKPPTGDRNTIITVVLVAMIITGWVMLMLWRRGKKNAHPADDVMEE